MVAPRWRRRWKPKKQANSSRRWNAAARWHWDPKEVWALITLIVYAFPLHPSLSISREPKKFFLYCTLAFFSVIITYFGVNLLLGGIHAYN